MSIQPMKGLRLATALLLLPAFWFVFRGFCPDPKYSYADHAARLIGTAGAGLLVANWWQRRRNAIDLCTETHSDDFLEVRSNTWNRIESYNAAQNLQQVASYFPELERRLIDGSTFQEKQVLKEALRKKPENMEDVKDLVEHQDIQIRRFKQEHGFSGMTYLMHRAVAYHEAGLLDATLFRRLQASFFGHYRQYFVEWAHVYERIRESLGVVGNEENVGQMILAFFELLELDIAMPSEFEYFPDPREHDDIDAMVMHCGLNVSKSDE